jgi:hypothetical protein
MTYQDGKMREFYAYAIDPTTGARNALGGSPMAVWAGVNTAAKTYFTNTVVPALNANCSACHSPPTDYVSDKYVLANPTKFGGGTATNNDFINRALGVNHPGGNRCGTASGVPCNTFQTWWGMEFN